MMKGRDILKDLTQATLQSNPSKTSQKLRPAGSVKTLKTELDKIANEAADAKELKESIAREGQIIKLAADSVDAASIGDRIPVQQDDKFDELKKSISDAGQQVPILVRPKLDQEGRYEAAYGHRRLRAAKELGIAVRAIVRQLSDREMILAQGQENGPRLDLSFIERAFYASRLLSHGHDRDLVCHALSVDKPEVSRLLKVAEGVNENIVMAIGPARKIGRPRWLKLSERLQNEEFLSKAKVLIRSPKFDEISDSNDRFEEVCKIDQTPKKTKKISKSQPKNALQGESSNKYGWSQITRKGASITLENRELSEFILGKLPSLVKQFEDISRSKK